MKNATANEIIQVPGEEYELLKEAIKQEINCAKPGIVRAFNEADQTATIELAIRVPMDDAMVKPPLLTDVPVFFPGGKNAGYSFDVEEGDECLVVFADSCIDAWFQSGGSSIPISVRKHDLSDGFAFVGFRSRANSLKGGSSNILLNKVYPIGAVYMSTRSDDPATLFGGEWEAMPEMLMYCWTRVG